MSYHVREKASDTSTFQAVKNKSQEEVINTVDHRTEYLGCKVMMILDTGVNRMLLLEET